MRRLTVAGVGLLCGLLLAAPGCGSGAKTAAPVDATAVSAQSAAGSEDASESGDLRIAIAGMVIPKEGITYYQGLCKYIGKKTHKRVRLIHKAEYAQVTEMLRQRKLDMAFVCSGPYVTGHDDFGLELLVAPQVKGRAQYQSYVIAAKSSPATSIASFAGKTYAFADPQSNSGRIVPTYSLAQMGTTPEAFFKKFYFTYSHDNSIKEVATGKVDGASVDSIIWEYENATSPGYTSKTKIVQRSDWFGIPPVVVHPKMAPALKEKLRNAFLQAGEDPEGAALLRQMRMDRFVEVDDSQYDSVRAMMKWLEDRSRG